MNITLMDRSNYYRGLLLLARKDRKITETEVALMLHIGTTLGFDREFCENAIHEILENEHVDTSPPVFSSSEVARKFIKDGWTLAAAEGDVHAAEVAWLEATAEVNGLDVQWLNDVKQEYSRHRHSGTIPTLEVESFVIEH